MPHDIHDKYFIALLAVVLLILFGTAAVVLIPDLITDTKQPTASNPVVDEPEEETEQHDQEPTSANKSDVSPVDTSDWKTYRNKRFGLTVQYPPEWSVTTSGIGAAIPATGDESNFFIGDNPGFQGISFIIRTLGFPEMGPRLRSADNIEEYLAVVGGNKSLRFVRETTIAGKKTYLYKQYQQDGLRLRVYFQHGRNIFDVTSYGSKGDKLFFQILSTLRFDLN